MYCIAWHTLEECGIFCIQGRNLSAVESVVRDIERVNKARSEVEQIKVSVELEKCFLREATHNIYCTADLVSESTAHLMHMHLQWFLCIVVTI